MNGSGFVSKYANGFNNVGYKARTTGTDLFRDCIVFLGLFYRSHIEEFSKERSDEFNRIKDKYDDATINFFKEFVLDLTQMLSVSPCDYLGELFQKIGANNRNLGQFYTPSHISTLMSEMTIGDVDFETIEKPYTISDPCCGSGSLLIGAVNTLKRKGVNYAYDTMMYATDIDKIACYMCYLQLNALGAAAVITHGNSLLNEVLDVMPTFGASGQSYLRSLAVTN